MVWRSSHSGSDKGSAGGCSFGSESPVEEEVAAVDDESFIVAPLLLGEKRVAWRKELRGVELEDGLDVDSVEAGGGEDGAAAGAGWDDSGSGCEEARLDAADSASSVAARSASSSSSGSDASKSSSCGAVSFLRRLTTSSPWAASTSFAASVLASRFDSDVLAVIVVIGHGRWRGSVPAA